MDPKTEELMDAYNEEIRWFNHGFTVWTDPYQDYCELWKSTKAEDMFAIIRPGKWDHVAVCYDTDFHTEEPRGRVCLAGGKWRKPSRHD